jgi:hypothetical protein
VDTTPNFMSYNVWVSLWKFSVYCSLRDQHRIFLLVEHISLFNLAFCFVACSRVLSAFYFTMANQKYDCFVCPIVRAIQGLCPDMSLKRQTSKARYSGSASKSIQKPLLLLP